MGSGEVRGASSLSAGQGIDGTRRGKRTAALLRAIVGGKGRRRLAARHAETATSSVDDRWGWTGARPVGGSCWRVGIEERRVRRARARRRTEARDCRSRFTVLPSHAYETLGKTILESYAEARAVVATDLGSRRELVQAGKTGLLYRVGDVEQLASAIRFLSSQPELADKMGRAGREQVRDRYTPEAHYEALIGLYERVVDRKKQSAGAPTRRTLVSGSPTARGGMPRGNRVGFVPLQRLVLNPALVDPAEVPAAEFQKRMLRVAFIGGRGVVSKYSGIETYYEEIGKRLTGMGHQG